MTEYDHYYKLINEDYNSKNYGKIVTYLRQVGNKCNSGIEYLYGKSWISFNRNNIRKNLNIYPYRIVEISKDEFDTNINGRVL